MSMSTHNPLLRDVLIKLTFEGIWTFDLERGVNPSHTGRKLLEMGTVGRS